LSKTEIIYGTHTVTALIIQDPKQVQIIYVVENKHPQLMDLLNSSVCQHIETISVSAEELNNKLGEQVVHQGVMAICASEIKVHEKNLMNFLEKKTNPLVLILDQVQDPHNLGACMRTANAMGACCVIVPKDRSSGMTPVVQKVSCGASVFTPLVTVTNLSRVLRQLKEQGLWLVGLAMEGDCILSEVDLSGPLGVVMGGEAKGLRQLTAKQCDYLARIDMQGSVSSLNVSVATGVALYEAVRQRKL
jgi:23S rRNA (guanosine2251-2'-O)-methyltransferase